MAQPISIAENDDVAVHFGEVTKHFGDVVALREVSLAIKRGEFMTLLGPSGCGKTTLLKLAAGFLSPDSGQISIEGELVNDVPTYKREIGMMFQNYAAYEVANRIEAGQQVEIQLSQMRRDERIRPHYHQRITIGRGTRHSFVSDHPACSRAVRRRMKPATAVFLGNKGQIGSGRSVVV